MKVIYTDSLIIGGGLDSSSTAVAEGGDTFPADRTATVAFTADTDVYCKSILT